MIINYTQQGWSVILQRSHGMLAAQICAHWRKTDQPARWVETLIATAGHDDGRDELAVPELNDATGGPKSFRMKKFENGQCDRLLELALSKSLFVGLLTARHVRFLYSSDPVAKSYCTALKSKELKWRKQAETTDQEISASYELLEFCDAFSLIICQDLMPPEGRTMEISSGPGGIRYQLNMSAEQHLKVTPWPFEIRTFQVVYESRCVAQLSFKNAGEFKEQLLAADVKLHKFNITA